MLGLAAETIDIESLKTAYSYILVHCMTNFQITLVMLSRKHNNMRGFVIHLLLTCNSQRTLRLMKKVNWLNYNTITYYKEISKNLTMSEFWISVETEFPNLSRSAVNYILPFASTYLCECGFSALTRIQNRYRSRLAVEDDLRACLTTNLQPRFDEMCSKKQAHMSHW